MFPAAAAAYHKPNDNAAVIPSTSRMKSAPGQFSFSVLNSGGFLFRKAYQIPDASHRMGRKWGSQKQASRINPANVDAI